MDSKNAQQESEGTYSKTVPRHPKLKNWRPPQLPGQSRSELVNPVSPTADSYRQHKYSIKYLKYTSCDIIFIYLSDKLRRSMMGIAEELWMSSVLLERRMHPYLGIPKRRLKPSLSYRILIAYETAVSFCKSPL